MGSLYLYLLLAGITCLGLDYWGLWVLSPNHHSKYYLVCIKRSMQAVNFFFSKTISVNKKKMLERYSPPIDMVDACTVFRFLVRILAHRLVVIKGGFWFPHTLRANYVVYSNILEHAANLPLISFQFVIHVTIRWCITFANEKHWQPRHQLTIWRRVLDKLIVMHVVKKIRTF